MIKSLAVAANKRGIFYPISLRSMSANPDANLISLLEILKNSGIILEIPFHFGVHNLPFGNFGDGIPDWGTFEDTFGALEVWHELLDPFFGHPILTGLFFGFYCYYLKGKANGGLATGFCTSLASLVADRLWQGQTDTITIKKTDVHRMLTAIHGKLLSRQSLLTFHNQGLEGIARVEKTYREIETTFLKGCNRNNAPLLFLIPSGDVWDSGYKDKLADSHCVMPFKFIYPDEHPGPQLSQDGSTTITDPDQVEMYVWDCNNPASPNCKIAFQRDNNGNLGFEFNSVAGVYSNQNGFTLGMMTNGEYMLADHDLPFSGPLGLTRFVFDFLLSPADLQVTDANGRRTGKFGGAILAEIPNSHPCYLIENAYLLPENTALTRKIVGNDSGTYSFGSIMPNGSSITLEGVSTGHGQEDSLSINADATQIRFTPGIEKSFSITLARLVNDQARALAIENMISGPTAEVNLTISPELSLLSMGNLGEACNLNVRAFTIDKATNIPINKQLTSINLPNMHDLRVAVSDWKKIDIRTKILAFG